MTVIPVDYAQVNYIYTGAAVPHGAQWTCGLFVANFTGDVADAAAELETIYNNCGLQEVLSTNMTVTGVLVKFGPDATGPSALEGAGLTHTGGTSGPPSNCWLVRKETPFGGKAGRGRMYLPGLPESKVSEAGVINSGDVTACQAAMDAWQAAAITAELSPVLLHGASGPITSPSNITAFNVQSIAATQRRRLRP